MAGTQAFRAGYAVFRAELAARAPDKRTSAPVDYIGRVAAVTSRYATPSLDPRPPLMITSRCQGRPTAEDIALGMLALAASLLLAADLPIVTVLHGDIKAKAGACQSWWCPQLVVTNANTTILSAQCKSPPPGKINPDTQLWIRSSDAGQSWTAPTKRPFFGTDVGQPVYSRRTSTVLWLGGAGQKAVEWEQQGDEPEQQQLVSPSCGPLDLCWASQLPQPTAKQLAACSSLITRSTDTTV